MWQVTSRKDQEQYWENKDEPYTFISAKHFAEAFQSFHVGRKLGDKLATPFDKSKGHPAVLTKNKFGVSKKELLKACVSREFLLMKRNSFVYIFKMWQVSKVQVSKVFVYILFDKIREAFLMISTMLTRFIYSFFFSWFSLAS